MANRDHATRPAGGAPLSPYSSEDAAIERRVRARVRRQAEEEARRATPAGGTGRLAAAFTAAALAAVFALDADRQQQQHPAIGDGDDATPAPPDGKGPAGGEQVVLAGLGADLTGGEDATWFAGPVGFDQLLQGGADANWALIPDDRADQVGGAAPPPATAEAPGGGDARLATAAASPDPTPVGPGMAEHGAAVAAAEADAHAVAAADHVAGLGDSLALGAALLGPDALAFQGPAEAGGFSPAAFSLASAATGAAEARGSLEDAGTAARTGGDAGSGGAVAGAAAAQPAEASGHGAEDAVAAFPSGAWDDSQAATAIPDAGRHDGGPPGQASRGEGGDGLPVAGGRADPPADGGGRSGVGQQLAGAVDGVAGHPGKALGLLLAHSGGDGGGSAAHGGENPGLALGHMGRDSAMADDAPPGVHQPAGHGGAGPGLADLADAALAQAALGPAEEHGASLGHGLGSAHHNALAGSEVILL